MIEPHLLDTIRSFSDFAALPEDAALELVREALAKRVAADEVLARQGAPIEFFPVALSGRARIFAMDEDGREITLYRIGPGDGCVLAAACCVSDTPLPGFAVAELAGDALFVPAPALRSWVHRYPFWRDYVFSLVARQLGQVIAVTNGLAFRHLDARIAGYLLDAAGRSGDTIRATHQAVAMEVGTRREVASRILKELEQAGIVALGRGRIRVQDRDALASRARASAPFG